jgi:hypothetical protein
MLPSNVRMPPRTAPPSYRNLAYMKHRATGFIERTIKGPWFVTRGVDRNVDVRFQGLNGGGTGASQRCGLEMVMHIGRFMMVWGGG